MSSVFGEEEEQALIASFLPERGYFVEVGAFEPILLSQTYQLEQRGWEGLLIEPVPTHADKLRLRRRARVVQVACGSPSQHGQVLPIYLAGGRTSLLYQLGPALEVPIRTLDSVLTETNVSQIDFLSIDVEGAEIDVLSGMSFERYRPSLILLEDFADDTVRHRFMRSRDYKRVRRTGNNTWYVPAATDFPLSLFDRLQLFRKYYLSLPIRRLKKLFRRIIPKSQRAPPA
jgi:FkbM family methyltransferase